MLDLAKLPKRIAERVEGLPWWQDDIGMSGSSILLFEKMVLKIERIDRSPENEHKLLKWLDGKLPVPKILVYEEQGGYSFLLMTRLPGEMACSANSLQQMDKTVIALTEGLKMLWQVTIADCPCTNRVADKLVQAQYNIENDLVNRDEFDEETFTTEGFVDVRMIALRQLECLSHMKELLLSNMKEDAMLKLYRTDGKPLPLLL